MHDENTTLADIRRQITGFCRARDWLREENAKNLAMALTVEAAELMEIFQWISSQEADAVKDNPGEFIHLREEIADVFWYLVRICEHFDIDLSQAVADKAVKNAVKYPE